jgi:DNA-binding response OmpR family regulator
MPTLASPSLEDRPVTRILACLTEAPVREVLRETLSRDQGFHVTHAPDGRSVIERLRSGHFQVLIVAAELPDLDAWRLARMVHSGRFCAHTVRIVVLCRPEDVKLLGARGAEYRLRLQSSADLEHLPETLAECLAGEERPQVLVIEDDRYSADLARAALDPLFHVQIAADGRTGLAHYRLRRHDLVLLDLALPDIPGEEVLGEIRWE